LKAFAEVEAAGFDVVEEDLLEMRAEEAGCLVFVLNGAVVDVC
jgi:hypothetical protein